MTRRSVGSGVALAAMLACTALVLAQNDKWNSPGLARGNNPNQPVPAGPAPRRDLTGIWDAGQAGVAGGGQTAAPFTAWGEEKARTYKPGNGPRMSPLGEIDDPVSSHGDPAGFPRNVLFELRPIQIVQTPNQVLILHMWEKRWRVIWTDGRQLPADPDPRWYGYSVGRWADDYTLVVQTVGMDERTWLDNSGNPHSDMLKVEERYHRAAANSLELTVTIDDPKTYTRPWTPLNRLHLGLMPADTDLMEMIPSATEAAEYQRSIASPTKK